MSKYMLSVHTADDEPREPMTDEEMRQGFALVEAPVLTAFQVPTSLIP